MGRRIAETERTYVAEHSAGDAPQPDLTGLPGVATVRALEPVDLEAVYFDTEDLRLAARSITLRRRTGGDDDGWHLKLPTGQADTRTEVRVSLASGTARTVPKSLSREVTVHTRGRRLGSVAVIVNHRQRTRLLDGDGTPLLEIAHDQVTAGEQRWTETEAELLAGKTALLDAVEERMIAAGLRRSAFPSKLRRALGDRVSEPPAPPQRLRTAGEAVLGHLHRRIGDITAQDPLVRRDEPDSVHQMRVAARRLRSALKTYRRELDRTATDPIGAELKWLAGVLGTERDREVLQERVSGLLDDLPARAGGEALRRRLTETLEQGDARAVLLRELRGQRYFDLLDDLDGLLAEPPLRRPARRPAEDAVAGAVRRDHRRLARQIAGALALPPGEERDEALHEARKAAKRVRYAAESAVPVLGDQAGKHVKRLKRLQELLGEHQDSVMCRGQLLALAEEASAAGEDTFGYGVLWQVERDRSAAVEDALPEAWRETDQGPFARR